MTKYIFWIIKISVINTNPLTFHILFTLVFLTGFLIAGTYRRKAQAGEDFDTSGEGRLFLPLRLFGLAIWGYCLVYIINPGWLAWSLFDVAPALRWTAGAVGLLLVPPLMIWAQRSLGRNVSTTVITRDTHELVTHGPYRWVRHPLYTIGLVFFFSLALISGSWFLLAALAIGAPFLAARTPIEEAQLIERFGSEYRDYMTRTGRYLPKIR